MTAHSSGGWLHTFSGRQVYPLALRPEDVCIEDIAHSLARQCRFGGHCRRHYSVAEHSILVSRLVSPRDALWGLLHDAAEAYCVDLPRPIKRSLPQYAEIESGAMRAICQRFGLPADMPKEVAYADNIMLATEARDLMGPSPAPWEALPEPLARRIGRWTIEALSPERAFLRRFRELYANPL